MDLSIWYLLSGFGVQVCGVGMDGGCMGYNDHTFFPSLCWHLLILLSSAVSVFHSLNLDWPRPLARRLWQKQCPVLGFRENYKLVLSLSEPVTLQSITLDWPYRSRGPWPACPFIPAFSLQTAHCMGGHERWGLCCAALSSSSSLRPRCSDLWLFCQVPQKRQLLLSHKSILKTNLKRGFLHIKTTKS